jgi:hypothetical protein
MKLLFPILCEDNKTLLICEPISKFLCPFCFNKNDCAKFNTDFFDVDGTSSSLLSLHEYDKDYINSVFNIISENKINKIIFAVSEKTLVENRKELFSFSKELFNRYKTIAQCLFINADFSDLLHLKVAYKYLTYVDYIVKNTNGDLAYKNSFTQCLLNSLSYIDLTKSFSAGKAIYSNFS